MVSFALLKFLKRIHLLRSLFFIATILITSYYTQASEILTPYHGEIVSFQDPSLSFFSNPSYNPYVWYFRRICKKKAFLSHRAMPKGEVHYKRNWKMPMSVHWSKSYTFSTSIS